MLNSFLNLCRVCPSMPIDKLHSEYRTNFRWHDTYHTPIHEDVHKSGEAPICCEPALPRRKKHPELAYRSNEVLGMANGGGESSTDSLDTDTGASNNVGNRARSELRCQPRGSASPRSKSVDPYLGRRRPLSAVVQVGVPGAGIPSSRQQLPLEHRLLYRRSRLDHSYRPPDQLMTQSYPPAAHVDLPPPGCANGPESGNSSSKVIQKTTEYRSQFAWPQSSSESIPRPETTPPPAAAAPATTPRKSISMGAIQVGRHFDKVGENNLTVDVEVKAAGKAPVRDSVAHRPREDGHPREETAEKRKLKKFKTEYKSKFRAPSKYTYMNGNWRPMSRSADSSEILQDEVLVEDSDSWFEEVAELRRKAGEYKCRSVVGNFPLPSSRQEMIEQVSKRSNLSALALATTPREKAKEEQSVKAKKSLLNEQTRAKRSRAKSEKAKTTATTTTTSSTTTKHIPPHHPHSHVSLKQEKRLTSGELGSSAVDGQSISARTPQPSVRHHLDRTTPTSGDIGVLITSPTRDHKLEPVQLQRNRSGSKKESKTKSAQRPSTKATDEPSTRASSITPTGASAVGRSSASGTGTHKSPKRAPRPMSMIVPGSKSVVNGSWNGTSTHEPSTQKAEVKQARPTTLATSSSATRPKTAPIPRVSTETTAKVHSAGQSKAPTKTTSGAKEKPAEQATEAADTSMVNGSDEQSILKVDIDAAFRSISSKCQETLENSRNKEEDDELRREIEETIKLKSPPEPTRVKSPEQIMVKSPETVNWTIPLETRIKWTSGPTKIDDDGEHVERIRSPPMMTSPVQNPSALIVASQPAGVLDVDQLDIINQNGISSAESMSSSMEFAI